MSYFDLFFLVLFCFGNIETDFLFLMFLKQRYKQLFSLRLSVTKPRASFSVFVGYIYHFLSCVKNDCWETCSRKSPMVNERVIELVVTWVQGCCRRPLLNHQQHKQWVYHKINKFNLHSSILLYRETFGGLGLMSGQFGLNNIIGTTRPVTIAKVNMVGQEGLGSLHKGGVMACHKLPHHPDTVLVWVHLYLGSPGFKVDKSLVMVNDNKRTCV